MIERVIMEVDTFILVLYSDSVGHRHLERIPALPKHRIDWIGLQSGSIRGDLIRRFEIHVFGNSTTTIFFFNFLFSI